MKKFILCLFFFTNLPVDAFARSQPCKKFPTSYTVSTPLTTQEIEQHELGKVMAVRKTLPNVPNVPFGFLNDEWLRFKSMAKPGDQIVTYSAGQAAWNDGGGVAGYAILRAGCVAKVFISLQS